MHATSNSNAQLDLDLGALRLVRDVSDRVERAPQVGNRLLVGAAGQGLGGGALVIGDGAHEPLPRSKCSASSAAIASRRPVHAASSRRPTRA